MSSKKSKFVESGDRWFEHLILPEPLLRDLHDAIDAIDAQKVEALIKEDRQRKDLARAEGSKPGLDPAASLVFGRLPGFGRARGIELYDRAVLRDAYRAIKTVGSPDRDRTKNRVALIESIAARGSERMLCLAADWPRSLAALRASFANFEKVIDVIEAELTLARKQGDGSGLRLPPLLLNGSPGCGKTFFAQHLAEFFGTGFVRISMETAQTAAVLTGTAEHWSNAQPGQLFEQLIHGDHINPVVLLDEIDKAGGYESHRSDKPLYALLERESAKRWSDLAFPALKLDTSHVIWVLTSKDASLIPAPLLTRMQQFDIPPLSPAAARALARTMYRQEVESHPGLDLEPELAIAHCDVLPQYSARELVRLCRALVARLVVAERRQVTLDDLKAVGALDGQLIAFERQVAELERCAGASLKWKRQ